MVINTDPAFACVRASIAIEHIAIGPMRELNLHQTRTSDRLLQVVKAVFRVLDLEPPVRFIVLVFVTIDAVPVRHAHVLCRAVVAQQQTVVDLTDHNLEVPFSSPGTTMASD